MDARVQRAASSTAGVESTGRQGDRPRRDKTQAEGEEGQEGL